MKKIFYKIQILIFLTILFFISPIVACSKQYELSKYFDSELNNVPQIYREQVKYTSTIAKILIASRHENMNTYAMPNLQYFLHHIAQNNEGTFTTKTGEKVIVRPYIDGYKQLNNLFWNMLDANSDLTYNGVKNKYSMMNMFVQMNDFDKLNTKKNYSHPVDKKNDFVVNLETAWAQYDTGAMVNILSQYSKSVIDYVDNISKNWGWKYYSILESYSMRNPGVSNIIFDNFIKSQPTNNEQLTLFNNKLNQYPTKYGDAITKLTVAMYKLYAIKYFALAAHSLKMFQHGLEFQLLDALTQLIPIVPNDYGVGRTFKTLLSLPFTILSLAIFDNNSWFNTDGSATNNSPLKNIFSTDTLKNMKIKYKYNNQIKYNNLQNILIDAINLGVISLTDTTDKNLYLDMLTPGHENNLLKFYAILTYWFDLARKKDNVNKFAFNHIISSAMYKLFNYTRAQIKDFPMASDASALIWIIQEMFNFPNFDLYNLIRFISSFVNWFYEYDGNDFVYKIENIQNIVNIFSLSTSKMSGFSTDIKNVNPKSEYGRFVLKTYGYDEKNDKFILGSLFNIVDIWGKGDIDIYSNNHAMYEFLNEIINFNHGYIGKMYNNIHKIMAENWFDNIFLDDKWYITAKGMGIDGNKLGVTVNQNGKITKIRYQLDYFGLKDASTNLNYHLKPIRYLNPLTGLRENGLPPKSEIEGYNLSPYGEKKWNYNDWREYDGNGEYYLLNSHKIKYSYIVEFINEARMLFGYFNKDDPDENNNSFKLNSFKWFYNKKRFY